MIEENVSATTNRADNDGGWKNILSNHLEDFVFFFWPGAYEEIDWVKGYEFLEQELQSVGIQEEVGKRYLDKLFKVYLLGGKEQWVLLHIELQHSKEEDFAERMFTYFYRIFDRYNRDVASMAVLVDKDPNWRPTRYHRKIWGSEITRTFEIVKLIDFQSKTETLLNNSNPFALAVLIQLAALEAKADDERRLLTKLEFFRALHRHGWSMEKAMNLYRFLDSILTLREEFEVQYIQKAKEIDQEFGMKLTLSAERYGYKLGETSLLVRQLTKKFGPLPPDYQKKIQEASEERLLTWGEWVIEASSLEEVFKH